jgi:hypothetical protein
MHAVLVVALLARAEREQAGGQDGKSRYPHDWLPPSLFVRGAGARAHAGMM